MKTKSLSQYKPFRYPRPLGERKGGGGCRILLLDFVSELFGNLLRDAIVGDLIERYFSVRELTGGLQRLDNLVHAFVRWHPVAAHRFFINRIGVFRYVSIYL